jgi:sulfonate transport system substrate-binding protein
MNRRGFLAITGTLAVLLGSDPAGAEKAGTEFRIGYQKNGVLLVAKQQKLIEKRLAPLGLSVTWVEFSFGPPLLEALNSGNIDFGTTGDAPPIFAQAAKANLLYVAASPAAGSGSAILVPAGSSIHSLADLRGKKIGFAKASSAHNLTIAALDKAGIAYSDITPVYLAPADAAAAFVTGALDAWTIWDPYYAIAERQNGTRVLETGRKIVAQNSYFLANRAYTEKNASIIGAVNDELAKASAWIDDHKDEAAMLFSQATGVDLEAQKKTVERQVFSYTPMTDAVAEEQQEVADRFYRLGLIPKPVVVRDIVWKWVPGSS